MTLSEFLLARIAEDETAASDARYCDRPGYGAGEDYDMVSDCDCGEDHASSSYLAVDPKRLLAECEAKRRIVERHVDGAYWCGWSQDANHTHADMGGLCDTLRALALPYVDHPDYREEWRRLRP